MLELVDLVKFEVVVAPKFGVASSHGVGGFQQVVAKETVAGLDEVAVLGLVVTGLVLRPNKADILDNERLGLKTVNVANLGDDAGGVDLADAMDGGQRVGDNLKLLLDGFAQRLNLALHGPYKCNGHAHGLVDGVVDGFG